MPACRTVLNRAERPQGGLGTTLPARYSALEITGASTGRYSSPLATELANTHAMIQRSTREGCCHGSSYLHMDGAATNESARSRANFDPGETKSKMGYLAYAVSQQEWRDEMGWKYRFSATTDSGMQAGWIFRVFSCMTPPACLGWRSSLLQVPDFKYFERRL